MQKSLSKNNSFKTHLGYLDSSALAGMGPGLTFSNPKGLDLSTGLRKINSFRSEFYYTWPRSDPWPSVHP